MSFKTGRPSVLQTLSCEQRRHSWVYGALITLAVCGCLPLLVPVTSAASALNFKRVQGLPRACESSGGVQASDGSLWTTCSQKAKSDGGLIRISSSGKVTGPFRPPVEPYNTDHVGKPTWNVADMVAGRSGSLWFTSGYGLVCNVSAAGHMDCARTPSSLKSPIETYTSAITEGADGNMWMLEEVQAKNGGTADASIVRITPLLQMTEFSLPKEWSMLPGLVLSSSGDLWFGRDLRHAGLEGVAYITPSGEIMSFPLAAEAVTSAVPELALPSGPVYFVAGEGNEHLDRVMPNGSQSVVLSLHTMLDVIPGAEESAWVLAQSQKAGLGYHYYKPGVLDRISASGAITSFPLSGRFELSDLQPGPGGSLWGIAAGYTEKALRLVSIGPSGSIVTRASFGRTSGRQPVGLVASPTSLWLFNVRNGGGMELERVTDAG
jgi:hypothetical protein